MVGLIFLGAVTSEDEWSMGLWEYILWPSFLCLWSQLDSWDSGQEDEKWRALLSFVCPVLSSPKPNPAWLVEWSRILIMVILYVLGSVCSVSCCWWWWSGGSMGRIDGGCPLDPACAQVSPTTSRKQRKWKWTCGEKGRRLKGKEGGGGWEGSSLLTFNIQQQRILLQGSPLVWVPSVYNQPHHHNNQQSDTWGRFWFLLGGGDGMWRQGPSFPWLC